MTQLLDITLTRGDDNDMTLTTGVDLSGARVRFTAGYREEGLDPVLEYSTDDGTVEVTDAAAGEAIVHVAAADWSAYSGRQQLVYDVEVTPASGKVSTPLKGRITVLQDVSR